MLLTISEAGIENSSNLARIIRVSNKDVASQFQLNKRNASKHPSFCRTEWVKEGMDRGETYFLCYIEKIMVGCVAFEHTEQDVMYLNRLAVLPGYRKKGCGRALVQHILSIGSQNKINRVSVGIIEKHHLLKQWYVSLGFTEKNVVKFDHLPFDVLYLEYDLK